MSLKCSGLEKPPGPGGVGRYPADWVWRERPHRTPWKRHYQGHGMTLAVKGKEMVTEFSEEKMRISSQLENAFSKAAEDFRGSGAFRLASLCFK